MCRQKLKSKDLSLTKKKIKKCENSIKPSPSKSDQKLGYEMAEMRDIEKAVKEEYWNLSVECADKISNGYESDNQIVVERQKLL